MSLETLRTLFNVVEGSILQRLYQDCTEASDNSRRSHALVLAAHIFMYVTLRRVPPNSPVVRRMCARLQTTIGWSPSASEVWTEKIESLLWIAFVGLLGVGEVARASPQGQWFLNLFRSTVKRWLEVYQERGTLRGTLSAFLWEETHCRPLLTELETGARFSLVLTPIDMTHHSEIGNMFE